MKHKIPVVILKRYQAWKAIVRMGGPPALRSLPGLRDHGLEGEWKGFRASYLDDTWRIIYRVQRTIVEVAVMRISAHNYRR